MDITSAKEAFKDAFPGVTVGITETEDGKPALAVRMPAYIPPEFEGFPVEVKIIGRVRSQDHD